MNNWQTQFDKLTDKVIEEYKTNGGSLWGISQNLCGEYDPQEVFEASLDKVCDSDTEKQLNIALANYIEQNFGGSEASDPCYSLEPLAKYLADELKGGK